MKLLVFGVAAALFTVVACASTSAPAGDSGSSNASLPVSTSAASASAPSTSAAPDFVGFVWLFTHVTTTSLSFDVHALSSTDPPRIQLTPDGQYGASDDVNYTSGEYTLTKSGFEPQPGESTLVAYAGNDPDEIAIMGAVGALTGDLPVTVAATNDPDVITMAVKGFDITLHRDGKALESSPVVSSTGPAPPIVYGTPPNCDLSTAPGNLPCPGDSLGPS